MTFTLADFLSAYLSMGAPFWIMGMGIGLGWSIARKANKTKIISNNTPSIPKGEFRLKRPEPPGKRKDQLRHKKFHHLMNMLNKHEINAVRAQTNALRKLIQEEAQQKLSYNKERVTDEDLERISKYLHAKRINKYLSPKGTTKMCK